MDRKLGYEVDVTDTE